jgi:opacity protein-like surface antigen
MKKALKAAVAASILASPAMAANMENPLFLPAQGQAYSKTTAGVMVKKADSSDAHVAKKHDGAIEFPIYRANEDIGYGITDHLSINGTFGYTHDGDISRQGMHVGRLGLTWRAFDSHDDFVWDIYADAHLGGVSKMTGDF